MTKILVTGSSGLLGTYLTAELLKDEGNLIYAGYHLKQLPVVNDRIKPRRIDIMEKKQVDEQIRDIDPDVIIHTAGCTSVDYCEQYPHVALANNVSGTTNVARAAKKVEARLIHISTNDVFGNAEDNAGWTELDEPNPINVYGRSKLEAEKTIQETVGLTDYIIVRTSFHGWCYRSYHSISHKIIVKLRQGLPINMAVDQHSSLIYAGDLSWMLHHFSNRNEKFPQLLHLSAANSTSRFMFAHEIARKFGLNNKLIQPVKYEEIWKELGLTAKRPMKAVLGSIYKYSNKLSLENGIVHMQKDEEFMRNIMHIGHVSW